MTNANERFSDCLNYASRCAANGQLEDAILALRIVDLDGVSYQDHARRVVRERIADYTARANEVEA